MNRRFCAERASGTGSKGDLQRRAAPPLSLPPLKIPLLKPLLCGRGSLYDYFGWVCAGQNIYVTCKFIRNQVLHMYLRIRSPKQRFIRSYVSRQHCPVQRKGGGISKGGNLGSPLWLRAKHAIHKARRSLSGK